MACALVLPFMPFTRRGDDPPSDSSEGVHSADAGTHSSTVCPSWMCLSRAALSVPAEVKEEGANTMEPWWLEVEVEVEMEMEWVVAGGWGRASDEGGEGED